MLCPRARALIARVLAGINRCDKICRETVPLLSGSDSIQSDCLRAATKLINTLFQMSETLPQCDRLNHCHFHILHYDSCLLILDNMCFLGDVSEELFNTLKLNRNHLAPSLPDRFQSVGMPHMFGIDARLTRLYVHAPFAMRLSCMADSSYEKCLYDPGPRLHSPILFYTISGSQLLWLLKHFVQTMFDGLVEEVDIESADVVDLLSPDAGGYKCLVEITPSPRRTILQVISENPILQGMRRCSSFSPIKNSPENHPTLRKRAQSICLLDRAQNVALVGCQQDGDQIVCKSVTCHSETFSSSCKLGSLDMNRCDVGVVLNSTLSPR